jgi:hypothetical protein
MCGDNYLLKTIPDATDSSGSPPSTPADCLLHALANDPDVSYVALYGKFESNLLTIRQKAQSDRIDEDSEINASDPYDLLDSPANTAHRIHGRLLVLGTGMVLLGVAWIDSASHRCFHMFPEICGVDVTEKTNSEGWPLMSCVGVDSNNKTFPFVWAFMPSQARWAFNWFFTQALPTLVGKSALGHLCCTFADGAKELYEPLDRNSGPGQLYARNHRHTCSFHKFNQNLTQSTDFKSDIASLKDKNGGKDLAEWKAIVSWLWSLCKDTETCEETEFSLALLELYLEEHPFSQGGYIGEQLQTKVSEFIVQQVQCDLDVLTGDSFVDIFTLGKTASSMAETENSAVKNPSVGVKANHNIAESHGRMSSMTTQRNCLKDQHALSSLTTLPSQQEHMDTTVVQVTKYASNLLFDQYSCSECFVSYRELATVCYVKLSPSIYEAEDGFMDSDVEDQPLTPRLKRDAAQFLLNWNCQKHVLPKFDQTRIVKLIESSDPPGKFVTCTCPYFWQRGLCCRHIYHVIDTKPNEKHAIVHWWKMYNLLCLQNDHCPDKFIPILKRMRLNCEKYPGIPVHDMTQFPNQDLLHGRSHEFFTSTLHGGPHLCGVGFWGTEDGKRLCSIVNRSCGLLGFTNHWALFRKFCSHRNVCRHLLMNHQSSIRMIIPMIQLVKQMNLTNFDEDSAGGIPVPSLQDCMAAYNMHCSDAYGAFHNKFQEVTKSLSSSRSTPKHWWLFNKVLHELQWKIDSDIRESMSNSQTSTGESKSTMMLSFAKADRSSRSNARKRKCSSPNQKGRN